MNVESSSWYTFLYAAVCFHPTSILQERQPPRLHSFIPACAGGLAVGMVNFMLIIGEKINGSIPSVARAIADKDAAWIQNLARIQAGAGADYIDVCASVKDNEVETLRWLIDLVQEATDVPVCIDSPNPEACVAAMPFCKRPGMINSVSMEGNKVEVIFPALAGTDWKVVALLCAKGIPSTAEERLRVFDQLMEKAAAYGIKPDSIFVDPLVEMLCTSDDGINVVADVIRRVKQKQPAVHVTGAVSNVSFNLPARKLLNQVFLVLAMNAGMDAGVLDPTSRDLIGAIYAAEAMLGMDEYCLEYIHAFRDNRFGPIKTNG